MLKRIDCTRTSAHGVLSRPPTNTHPLRMSLELDDQHLGTVVANPAMDVDSTPIWNFNTQWLNPVTAGTALRLSTKIQQGSEGARNIEIARTLIPDRDAKHAMFSAANNYAMFYNPKSACTTVRRLFYKLHGHEVKGKASEDNLGIAPIVFLLAAKVQPDFKINVVRDPRFRIVSAYAEKIVPMLYSQPNEIGIDVFRWRFGENRDEWAELTFIDFLCYLHKYQLCADIHFQSQPVIDGDVEVVKVENIKDGLIDVYRRRRPDLLETVLQFFDTPESKSNQSPLSQPRERSLLRNPALQPAYRIAAEFESGKGIPAESFINPSSELLLSSLVATESRAFGYAL